MTKITIFQNQAREYLGFSCLGHAGYADAGEDIVCAGISALVINTVNSLEELVHEEMELVNDETTGYIDCRFPNEISEHAKLLIDSMILGLESIVSQCGKKYLRLKFEEV